MVGAPGTPDLQRRARNVEHLLGFSRVQVPHHHGISEPLHRLLVVQHLAEIHHVVRPTGE